MRNWEHGRHGIDPALIWKMLDLAPNDQVREQFHKALPIQLQTAGIALELLARLGPNERAYLDHVARARKIDVVEVCAILIKERMQSGDSLPLSTPGSAPQKLALREELHRGKSAKHRKFKAS